MKITDISPKETSSQMIQQYQKGEKISQPVDSQAGAAVAKEKVDISAQARDIQQAKKVIAGTPDVREERVRELKARIEQGTYKINTEKIAEKMVKESLIDIFA